MGEPDERGGQGGPADPAAERSEAEATLEQVFAALDLLERYFNQRHGYCGRAVDFVLALRLMASWSSLGSGTIPADASNPFFEGRIDPGHPGREPIDPRICPGQVGEKPGREADAGREIRPC